MNDEIIKLLTDKYFNKQSISDWAIKCLEKGYDSKSLRILASIMDSSSSPSEIDNYFQRTLKELDWNKISPEDFLIRYAKIIAKEIVEDKTNPIQAASEISLVLMDLYYPPELGAWFDTQEMIWDYNYFLETGDESGYWFRSKDNLILEIKKASKELLESE